MTGFSLVSPMLFINSIAITKCVHACVFVYVLVCERGEKRERILPCFKKDYTAATLTNSGPPIAKYWSSSVFLRRLFSEMQLLCGNYKDSRSQMLAQLKKEADS